MERLEKADQDVLRLLGEGVRDHEICQKLRISQTALSAAIKRIGRLADEESDHAGRLYEKALRQRSEIIVHSMTARLHALMDILPQAVLIIDGRTGAIKDFNEAASRVFGYTKEQFAKVSVEELVPMEHRDIHVAYRLGFLNSVRKREMGYHPPIFGVRRDGSKVEMAIALTATPNDDDVMVVCTERTNWLTAESLVKKRATDAGAY